MLWPLHVAILYWILFHVLVFACVVILSLLVFISRYAMLLVVCPENRAAT